jgi:hypothetical protein
MSGGNGLAVPKDWYFYVALRGSLADALELCQNREGMLIRRRIVVVLWAATAIGATPPMIKPPILVIGFVGGFVRHDDAVHSPVEVGERIRKDYPQDVYVKVFENRRREQALEAIRKRLDTNHDGTLSEEEKHNARIILYGMSWGGSETVALARELAAENIPVLLTVQVDSVQKPQENDEVIPSNVAEAINFYQLDGFLHGRAEIRAEDPARTKILGNFRFTYKAMPTECENYPWWDRWFVKPHTEIECDPAVWSRVEALIRSKLPPAEESLARQR